MYFDGAGRVLALLGRVGQACRRMRTRVLSNLESSSCMIILSCPTTDITRVHAPFSDSPCRDPFVLRVATLYGLLKLLEAW